jgi:hypothetical protein
MTVSHLSPCGQDLQGPQYRGRHVSLPFAVMDATSTSTHFWRQHSASEQMNDLTLWRDCYRIHEALL